jgi:hypothetical protein
MNLRQKENLRTNINRIGYYQIIGGIFGIIITFYGIYLSLPFSGFTAWLLVLSIVLYLFSIFCGQLLLKGKYLLGLKLLRSIKPYKYLALRCLVLLLATFQDFAWALILTIQTTFT